RSQWSSPRDRELQFARSQIENAPIIRNSPEHYASTLCALTTTKIKKGQRHTKRTHYFDSIRLEQQSIP
ncbi:hypothetical protein U1Q18_014304, partial [Sarracenia purpurea var. burkii]